MVRVGPILNRELVTFLRRQRAFWILLVYLGLIFLFTLMTGGNYLSGGPRGYQAVFSRRLFIISSVFQIGLFGVLAAFLSAHAISSERQRNTFEVLRTSPLRAYEIVLGKVLAPVSYLVILALAAIPMYSVCFLLGGVGWTEIALMVYLTLLTIVAYSIIGVATSSSPKVKRTGEGGGGAIPLLLLINAGVPVAAGVIANTVFKVSVRDSQAIAASAFVLVCPPATFFTIMESYIYKAATGPARTYFTVGHTLVQVGIILFFLWRACRAVHKEAVIAVPHTKPRDQARRRVRLAFLRLFPVHDFVNPVAAKDVLLALPKRTLDRYAIGLLAAALFGLGAYAIVQSRSFRARPSALFDLGCMIVLALVAIAVFLRASAVVVSERDSDTDGMLFATSLRPEKIVSGKLQGVIASVAGSTFVLAFALSVLFCIIYPGATIHVVTRVGLGLLAMLVSSVAFGALGIMISAGAQSVRVATNTAVVFCAGILVFGVPMTIGFLIEADVGRLYVVSLVFPAAAMFMPPSEQGADPVAARYFAFATGTLVALMITWFCMHSAAELYRFRAWQDRVRPSPNPL